MDHIVANASKPPLVKYFSFNESNLSISRKIRKTLLMLQDERVRQIEAADQMTSSVKTVGIARNFTSGLGTILAALTAVLTGTSAGPISTIMSATISAISNLADTTMNRFVKIRKWPQKIVQSNTAVQRLDMLIRICADLKPDGHALRVIAYVQREFDVMTNRTPLDSVVVMADTGSLSSEENPS